jgi:mRNA-degrading endonuclease toxin of MazEF toxin-antitoxin module
MKRGEVYWADLVPRSGSVRTGRSPVILVSHDGFNQTPGWRSIIVSRSRPRPRASADLPSQNFWRDWRLGGDGFAVCHQVTTRDRAKLTRRLGTLPSQSLHEVEEGLKAAMDPD